MYAKYDLHVRTLRTAFPSAARYPDPADGLLAPQKTIERLDEPMDSNANNKCPLECFYGAVTVGERGQIVIPAEARKEIGIQAGDKLLIWKHPSGEGLMAFKVEAV